MNALDKKEVLVFGNMLDKNDSLAFRVAEKLKQENGFIFKKADSLLSEAKNKDELIIMDVAEGLKKVKLITAEELSKSRAVSAHDFDLALEIMLIKKLHPEKDIKVIGIPLGYSTKKAVEEVKVILGRLK